MKNIHILPKKEKLNLNKTKFHNEKYEPMHFYITSDEEIKNGDWFYNPFINEIQINCNPDGCKKIILTTDQDLIKYGVQAIDDEFLEWFVKNPSCESVETIYDLFNPMGRQVDPNNLGQNHSQCIWKHKIIIPKEEPKQENDYTALLKPVGTKQETLEEIVNKLSIKEAKDLDLFLKGIQWQQKQDKNKYSEEEVFRLLVHSNERHGKRSVTTQCIKTWFEQFKNK